MIFNIKMEENELKHLVEVLGDLPTKLGVYNTLSRIVGQANHQLEEAKNEQKSNTEPV